MSKDNKEYNIIERLKKLSKNHRTTVVQAELDDIPKSSQLFMLLIHVSLISSIFFRAQTNPYNNWLDLGMCFYLTGALVFLSFKFKERIKTSVSTSMKAILMSTIIGLLIGFISYHSPIGEKFEQKQLTEFFENHKTLINKTDYTLYLNNKDNLVELKELRQKINNDLNI